VHLGAAEFLFGGNFAGRSLQQRRARRERTGAAAHHYDVIGEPGLIRAPAVDDPCVTVTTGSPAADSRARLRKCWPPLTKSSTRVAQQLAPALSTAARKALVLQCEFLHPQRLVEAQGLQRAGIDTGIVALIMQRSRRRIRCRRSVRRRHALVGVRQSNM